MNKTFINTLVTNLKKAGILTKASPWIKDEFRGEVCESRYVGVRLTDNDWTQIFSPANNLLLKFNLNKQGCVLEYYLANQPPFTKITQTNLKTTDKWEYLLGELKRRLRMDKDDYKNHRAAVGNLYAKIADVVK